MTTELAWCIGTSVAMLAVCTGCLLWIAQMASAQTALLREIAANTRRTP